MLEKSAEVGTTISPLAGITWLRNVPPSFTGSAKRSGRRNTGGRTESSTPGAPLSCRRRGADPERGQQAQCDCSNGQQTGCQAHGSSNLQRILRFPAATGAQEDSADDSDVRGDRQGEGEREKSRRRGHGQSNRGVLQQMALQQDH